MTDVSYGRVEGETGVLGFFPNPTPGTPNSTGGSGFAAEVAFSQPSGPFTHRLELRLSTESARAIIRYTLDGSLPTNSSPVYGAPIVITNSAQVRARAFEEGLLPGPPRSEAFFLLASNVVQFNSDLPVMVLHTLGKGTPNTSTMTPVLVSVHEPVGGRTYLHYPPTLTSRAAIQIRGSSTSGLAKSSYKLELRDEFGYDLDRPLLGMPEDSDWVLYAPNQYEPVLIHNPFVHQLSRDMGCYSPRTRFVEVYLNRSTGPITSANYMGIYVLEEKITIGPERVAIDKLEPEHNRFPEITGGYVLKVDRLDPGDRGFSAGGVTAAHVDPKERELRMPQRLPQLNYLSNYFRSFNRSLTSTNWRDPTTGYQAYIDVDSWIDYHVLEVLSGNVDALVLSAYFHKPRQQKIKMGPHWDFDRALGSTDGRDANPRQWSTGPFFSAPWWSRLFADPDFWQQWVDRWQELRASAFSLAHMNALIDRLADEVRQAQPRESQKWRVTLRGGSYQSEVNRMKTWISNRVDFIDRQITRTPAFSRNGGLIPKNFPLTILAPTNATVYYTLDGSDPRASGGGISTRAMVYTQPIRLSTNTRVVARARDPAKRQSGGPPASVSTPWSSPVAATFVTDPPPLMITEIMFHPAPPSADAPASSSDFEFVELKNTGTETINLLGFRLSGGIDFTFTSSALLTHLAPGDRLVLVNNQAAFQSRYPDVRNLGGEYSGSLGNRGNPLLLTGPRLETVFDFAYEDDWAPLADGFGFSLVLADETIPPIRLGDTTSWRLSAQPGGSPGTLDPPSPVLPKVYLNEIVSHPAPMKEDALELFNDSQAPADVSGWWLTDDYREPKKLQLPSGTVIPPQDCVVLGKSILEPKGKTGFGLSLLGESVYLFSGDSRGELTGWCHGFDFGAQEQGSSFGRWITSDRRAHLVPYAQPSLGTVNPEPIAGPVILSEIMFHPPLADGVTPWRDQFIELTDTTRNLESFPLYDPADPSRTWGIRGDIEFDFPPGFRFPDNRRVILAGFDPSWNTEALAGFRARYRLDKTVTILGPWRGTLNAGRGFVRLLKPLGSSDDPTVGALVEEVNYLSHAPWPDGAAGTGFSIVRHVPPAFADDPAHWSRASATPGDQDADDDALPDRWEIAHGLDPLDRQGNNGAEGDPDSDGFTNEQEFLAGTSPDDPDQSPKLEVSKNASGETLLTVQAGPSRSYTILWNVEVSSENWQVLKTQVAPLEGGPLVFIDRATNAARFYRLRVP
ncbi:MAG TPA: CotH kinase family protein [Candidatus Paceibacterota bacterium]|nr:CotH kinase family protein [Candidatus Paceibacterota bacterium]